MTEHTWAIIAAGIIGFIAGFLLMNTGFVFPGKVRKLLQLKENKLLKVLLWSLLTGLVVNCLLFYLDIAEFDIPERGFWPSLLGGVIAGTGIVLCGMTPVCGIAAAGSGRLSVVFAATGMLLAFPVAGILKKWIPEFFNEKSGKLATPVFADEFFTVDNPVIWTLGVTLLILCITAFINGKND